MTNIKRLLITIVSLLILPLTVSAQINSNANDTLDKIIRQMKDEGNEYFIMVQAYKDGLLKEKTSFDFNYNKGVMKLNGKLLPEPQKTVYTKMFQELKPNNQNGSWSTRSEGLKLEDILNPGSTIRKKQKDFNSKEIINILAADKLIDTNQYTRIVCNHKGIFINDKKLEGEVYNKYQQLFQLQTGYSYLNEGCETSITLKP